MSNLAVRDHHTFAVSTYGLLVHNETWCDVLKEKGRNVPEELFGALKQYRAVLAAQGVAQKVLDNIRIHGHHIVMKTNPSSLAGWTEEARVRGAQELLEKQTPKIKLLATKAEAQAAHADEMTNMCYAINDIAAARTGGIHSPEYARAVFDRLKEANDKGPGFVKAQLDWMAEQLERGHKFW